MGAGLGGGWAGGPHLAFAYARVDYTKYNGTTSVDKSFAHVRYNYEFENWLWGEVFAQAQSDAFQRLDLRNLFGAGPRFRVLHDLPAKEFDALHRHRLHARARCHLSGRRLDPEPTNQTIQVWHRMEVTTRPLQWEIDGRAILATTFYVQPAFDDFGDVRLLSETLFTFKIAKYFSSSIAITVRYDSEPPTGVLSTDSEEVKSTLAASPSLTAKAFTGPPSCFPFSSRRCPVPEKKTIDAAKKDAKEGKSASTQAGEFVREEIHHVREGKHGARNAEASDRHRHTLKKARVERG